MAEAVTDLDELCRLLDLPAPAAAVRQAADRLPLLVPRPFLERIQPGDPRDPLLLQVIPQEEELCDVPGFNSDPVGEQQEGGCRGLLWKYPNRALMVTNPACGVHCRFCFRRHFPFEGFGVQGSGFRTSSPPAAAGGMGIGGGNGTHFPAASSPPQAALWEPAIERIAAETSIREVILSGGDPLALDDPALGWLARRLADVRHLRRLRIHTRMPIVIPDRVTPGLIDWIRGGRLSPVMVLHVNHAREIDAPVAAALGRLAGAGVPLLAQAVLLRGVNDRLEVLLELFERLVDHRVLPYYLHQLDRVAGAAHFEVPVERGRELLAGLRGRLPGYAVPRYVREVAGEPSKRVLA
jgi:L-lysine 2,3-aminomutase